MPQIKIQDLAAAPGNSGSGGKSKAKNRRTGWKFI